MLRFPQALDPTLRNSTISRAAVSVIDQTTREYEATRKETEDRSGLRPRDSGSSIRSARVAKSKIMETEYRSETSI